MKFSVAAIATAALAAVVAADPLQISNPTQGTVWTAGTQVFIQWTGNCDAQGASGKQVIIDLNQGESTAVRFVRDLGTLDCTSNSTNGTRHSLSLPADIASGEYSIRVNTVPASYTNKFTINGQSAPAPAPAPATSAPSTSAPTTEKPKGAASGVVAKTGAVAAAAIAAAAILF